MVGRRSWSWWWFRGAGVAVCLLAALAGAPGSASAADRVSSPRTALPVPAGLRPQVEFWKKVFAEYSELDVAIHDREDVSRVYKVLRLGWLLASGGSKAEIDARRRSIVFAEIEAIRATLKRLHAKRGSPSALGAEERRIAGLFAGDRNPRRYLEAAAEPRIRAQSGLRERFAHGLHVAQRYLPFIERVFLLEGIPLEITRLPLVESSFNVEAYSRAGAAGLWQFMPATGRDYLRIDEAVDERRDPFLATIAAAKFLKGNYERLQSWPLAVTAYNHGRGGMMRAVDQLGTRDLMEIIRRYDGRTFGFASKNFYAELIAVVEIERDQERYFGAIPPAEPIKLDTFTMSAYVAFSDVARAAGLPQDELAAMNLALLPSVTRGDLHVPRGYALRLPDGTVGRFRARFAALPPSSLHARQRVDRVWHRVRSGETLSTIARRYGTSVGRIVADNGLRDANHVRVGQRLQVRSGTAAPRSSSRRTNTFVTHRVAPGQTLSSIARRYGISVASIEHHNGIRDRNHLRTGEQLRIPRR